MRIKDLCPEERPREKMHLRGAKALSNAELLAILLGSGTGGKNVMEIAHELLASADGKLTLLFAMPLERLVLQKGVGEARAFTISAAMELGRRTMEECALADKRAITCPEMVYRLMLPSLKNLDHEECWAVYLNRANFVLGKEMICSGSLESTLVDTNRILRRAIEKQSAYVVLVHNHPSGSPLPGKADIHQTDRVRNALASVEISLMDHVIIADDCFFSFAEERVGRQ
jgi:DNA repair protein RadC